MITIKQQSRKLKDIIDKFIKNSNKIIKAQDYILSKNLNQCANENQKHSGETQYQRYQNLLVTKDNEANCFITKAIAAEEKRRDSYLLPIDTGIEPQVVRIGGR